MSWDTHVCLLFPLLCRNVEQGRKILYIDQVHDRFCLIEYKKGSIHTKWYSIFCWTKSNITFFSIQGMRFIGQPFRWTELLPSAVEDKSVSEDLHIPHSRTDYHSAVNCLHSSFRWCMLKENGWFTFLIPNNLLYILDSFDTDQDQHES